MVLLLASSAVAQDVVVVVEGADGVSAPRPRVTIVVEDTVEDVVEDAAVEHAVVEPAPVVETPVEVPAPLVIPQPGPLTLNQSAEQTLARIEELRLRRPSLGGPLTMIIGGAVTGFASALAATLYATFDDWDCSGDCGPGAETIGFAALSVASLITIFGGIALLARRARERRRVAREIRALQETLPAAW